MSSTIEPAPSSATSGDGVDARSTSDTRSPQHESDTAGSRSSSDLAV